MTIAEMRDRLGLGPEYTDAQVAIAYEAYLSGGVAAGDGAPVVTLEEVKEHLRILHNREDGMLTVYLAAALADLDGADGWLGRALIERTYVRTFNSYDGPLRLPYPPVVSVTSVEVRGADGTWSAVTDWELIGRDVVPGDAGRWSAIRPIRVTYRAGYDPSAGRPLPANIKAAILLMVADLHENRVPEEAPRSSAVNMLLQTARVYA